MPDLGTVAVAPGACERGGTIRAGWPGTQANSRNPLEGPSPALQMILVTTRVLELGQLVAAGDMAAMAKADALAALLELPMGR